ncbi:amphi-Trp domain-containing protein [Marinomonas sp. 15G1-11]|uniref:Amphi-Trp domain-containing protein n=1 Tax=Marinomonas phaeophyticola TaxID=3004091 RepID=A0ABT4JU88_9GAMM|nr:amphi-Trp domain-containing protein [Marinomonas sp. 15G1-11]MCZ2721781.1 amphi-Trp domain-containing protein [Marinomonas sp. 15G1-11]
MRLKNEFQHVSLQDPQSIQELLISIAQGISKGEVSFSDEEGELVLQPNGLLDVKITASEGASRHKIELKVSWNKQNKILSNTPLKIK